MRLLVLADIHANEIALEAVLEDCPARSTDQTICLGDLVGYGANPIECVERIRSRRIDVVAGNHDIDALKDFPLQGTQTSARRAQLWTREQLGEAETDYLKNLPRILLATDYVAVHGCYLNPSYYCGYVTSTMLERNLSTIARSDQFPPLAFCGHTHAPMFGFLRKGRLFEPNCDTQVTWPEGCEAVVVNPGSVGQPRDGDLRAAYALVDTQKRSAEFRRVPYDVGEAARRIRAVGLPEENATRLLEGR